MVPAAVRGAHAAGRTALPKDTHLQICRVAQRHKSCARARTCQRAQRIVRSANVKRRARRARLRLQPHAYAESLIRRCPIPALGTKKAIIQTPSHGNAGAARQVQRIVVACSQCTGHLPLLTRLPAPVSAVCCALDVSAILAVVAHVLRNIPQPLAETPVAFRAGGQYGFHIIAVRREE